MLLFDLKWKLVRYIRPYNVQPRPVKWKYCDLSRRITPDSNVLVHEGLITYY
jgi:hypothetical protein